MPHFDVATVDGRRVRYADLWQHRHLIGVSVGAAPHPGLMRLGRNLLARASEFEKVDASLVISAETIAGLPSPGVIVADRCPILMSCSNGSTSCGSSALSAHRPEKHLSIANGVGCINAPSEEGCMRRSIVTALVAAGTLAFTFAASAQQAPKEHTMTGCLQKGTETNTYLVTSTAEKGPKTIGIVESKANLAPHVGHKIDITGMAVPAKEAENAKPTPPKADHYMKLSAIKMVSSTCP